MEDAFCDLVRFFLTEKRFYDGESEIVCASHTLGGDELTVADYLFIRYDRALKIIFKSGEAGRALSLKESELSENKGGGADRADKSAAAEGVLNGYGNGRTLVKIGRAGHTAGEDYRLGLGGAKLTLVYVRDHGDSVRADYLIVGADCDGSYLKSCAAQDIDGRERLNFFKSVC